MPPFQPLPRAMGNLDIETQRSQIIYDRETIKAGLNWPDYSNRAPAGINLTRQEFTLLWLNQIIPVYELARLRGVKLNQTKRVMNSAQAKADKHVFTMNFIKLRQEGSLKY